MTVDRTAPHHAPTRAPARAVQNRIVAALQLEPMPALEWTTERLKGQFEPLASWSHLARIITGLGSAGMPYVVVQRIADPGKRFVQCLGMSARLIVELGALDASSGTQTVQRVRQGRARAESIDVHPDPERRQPADLSELLTADHFLRIAHDWLTIGIAPGFDLERVALDLRKCD